MIKNVLLVKQLKTRTKISWSRKSMKQCFQTVYTRCVTVLAFQDDYFIKLLLNILMYILNIINSIGVK